MYVLAELRYVLTCQVKEKNILALPVYTLKSQLHIKKYSVENALVEKSENSTRNKIHDDSLISVIT